MPRQRHTLLPLPPTPSGPEHRPESGTELSPYLYFLSFHITLVIRLLVCLTFTMGQLESPSSSEGKVITKEEACNVTVSDQRLLDLGYRPEFRREMSLFGVLGISFCSIGILNGMSSALQTGLFSGGPLGLFWGWNVILTLNLHEHDNNSCSIQICSLFMLLIAFSFAEICSA